MAKRKPVGSQLHCQSRADVQAYHHTTEMKSGNSLLEMGLRLPWVDFITD